MATQDIFADIRRHAGSAGSKFVKENVVITAIDEILQSQGLEPSPVSYMGGLLVSLQAGYEPAVLAAVLMLLDRTLEHVPRAVLSSKAGRISTVLVSIANAHAEHALVLRNGLGCVLRLLNSQASRSGPPGTESTKLFSWLLEFTAHASPKVRQRGQLACASALGDCPALSRTAARFVEARLAAVQVRPSLV